MDQRTLAILECNKLFTKYKISGWTQMRLFSSSKTCFEEKVEKNRKDSKHKDLSTLRLKSSKQNQSKVATSKEFEIMKNTKILIRFYFESAENLVKRVPNTKKMLITRRNTFT